MSVFAVFIVVFLTLPSTGCSAKNSKREKFLKQMQQDQEKYQKLARSQEVDGERASDATNWLEFTNTSNVLPSTTRPQTIGYRNSLLDAGAPKVLCVYVTRDATFKANMCNSLLIEMPKDSTKRKEVLRAFSQIEKEFWGNKFNKVEDQGQAYLLLNMDP